MGITKFSKDVLLIGSDFKNFDELDARSKETGIKSIERVLERLIRLGFRDFKVIGDNSLSIEIVEELHNKGFEPTVFDMYPYTERKMIFSHLLPNGRDNLCRMSGLVRPTAQDLSHHLAQLEVKIAKILDSELSFSNEIPDEDKVEIILRVMALTYTHTPFTETTLFDFEDDVLYFLVSIKKTKEEVCKVIKADLEYRWKWAKEVLSKKTRANYNVIKEEHIEPIDVQSMELSEVFSLLDAFTSDDKKSEIDYGISDNIKPTINPEIDREEVNIKSEYTLMEGITQLNNEQFYKDQLLVDQLDTLLKVIDEYYYKIYDKIVEESNLIVDFYVSTTGVRHKKLPYNSDANKILLSVDLKSGWVEAFFKGRQFKISSFFNRDEEVQTNALEW